MFTRWRERYFTLKDGVLDYYMERGGVLRGKIHMKICEINETPEDPLKIILT